MVVEMPMMATTVEGGNNGSRVGSGNDDSNDNDGSDGCGRELYSFI